MINKLEKSKDLIELISIKDQDLKLSRSSQVHFKNPHVCGSNHYGSKHFHSIFKDPFLWTELLEI